MKIKLHFKIIGLIICFGFLQSNAQSTYTWSGGSSSWATASNWTPARNTPAATDILQFTGGTVTITNVPTQTIGQLSVSGGAAVTLNSNGVAITLTIGGGTGTDLTVASGCQLNIAQITNVNAFTLALGTGATGSITGNMTISSATLNTPNVISVADVGSLVFNNGSIFTQSTNCSGSIFGTTGTAGVVVFNSGSTFAQAAGANPFGLTAPATKVTFQSGSLVKFLTGVTTPSATGRTYPNVEWASTGIGTITGGTTVTMDNLTVTAGTFNVNLTGGANIKGNVSVASGATLTFTPSSAANITFNGTTSQTISNAGTLTFTATANVVIANTATTPSVTFNNAQTISGSMTVNSGSILATAATLTLSGTPAINGSFQINQGGWATGGTWNYGASGTLIFNNTSGPYGVNADVFWPTTNGPMNVTVQNGGGINMNVARTVPSSGTTGTFLLVSGTNAVQGTALTLNGTTQINGGNFQTTPTYGSASTLIYNTIYSTSNEWTAGAVQGVVAGSGIPANVTVATGTVTLAGGRGTPGNLTVNSGCGMVLNATSGDLYIGGNLTNNGSTWTNNSRAVAFVNSGTSTVTASSGTQFFDYLLVNKTSGSVQLSSTDVTINTASGSVLQFLNAGTLDLNGRTLTLNNSGGNILVNGTTGGTTKSITSTTAATVAITNAKTVTSTASGTLSFGANIKVLLTGGGVDFGSSLSTINGSLQINSGGYVVNNPPTYASGSFLYYNSGAAYGVGPEWIVNATSGAGVPYNVTIGNGVANSGLTFPTSANYRQVTNNFTLANATSTFSMGATIGGDLKVGGNFVNNGTFSTNNRAVFFVGGAAQTITGATTFDYLLISQTASSTVTLNNDITINQLLTFGNGKIVTGSNTVIMGSTGASASASSNSYIYGKQRYPISASGSKTFDIGDATVWAPVTTNFTAVGTAGNLTINTTAGDHANITTSNINSTYSVNRNWTLTATGGLAGTYSPTFTFVSGDIDAGATTSRFMIGRYNSGWAEQTIGTKNALNTQATAVTTFGDFQIGENKSCRWDGTAWSNVVGPDLKTEGVIAGAYTTTSNGVFTAKKLTMETASAGDLTVNTGHTITVVDDLINNLAATKITFQNGASLLQTNNVANTGSITYKRNTSIIANNYDFVYWGTPVAGQTLSSMWMTTANDTFYSFNTAATGGEDWLYAAPSDTMIAGKGYIARAVDGSGGFTTGNTWNSSFVGTPNNGNITYTVVDNGGTNIDNLMSNPYPSALDLAAFRVDSGNSSKLTGNFYFWTHSTPISSNAYAQSDYAAINIDLGAAVSTSMHAPAPDKYVDAGQGFFAEAATGGGVVTFKNSHRVAGNNNSFYKNNHNNSNTTNIVSNKIWLNLYNDSGLFKQQLLAYANEATNSFDTNLDAKSFEGNPDIDFYSLMPNSNNHFVIQSKAMQSFRNDDITMLGYKSSLENDYTIAIDHFDPQFAGKTVYLHDYDLGIDYNLSEKPYNFHTKAGTFNYRFVLKYSSYLTDAPETGVQIANAGEYIKVKSIIKNIDSIEIFDVLGRKLLDKSNLNTPEFIATNINNKEVLFIVITLINGKLVVKKV